MAGTISAALVDVFVMNGPAVASVLNKAPVATSSQVAGTLESTPVSRLVRRANDEREETRFQAVDELGRRGAIRELAQLLGHERADVRQRVPRALMMSSQAAHEQIPLLAAGLQSADPDTRKATAEALLVLVRTRGPYRGAEEMVNRAADERR